EEPTTGSSQGEFLQGEALAALGKAQSLNFQFGLAERNLSAARKISIGRYRRGENPVSIEYAAPLAFIYYHHPITTTAQDVGDVLQEAERLVPTKPNDLQRQSYSAWLNAYIDHDFGWEKYAEAIGRGRQGDSNSSDILHRDAVGHFSD